MKKTIEIEKRKKFEKYNINDYKENLINFSSIQKLKGNKIILEYIFQSIKNKIE